MPDRATVAHMWRALVVFVVLILGAGIYVLATGSAQDPAANAAAPEEPSSAEFGYALAAGSIALAATMLATRPRGRFRR